MSSEELRAVELPPERSTSPDWLPHDWITPTPPCWLSVFFTSCSPADWLELSVHRLRHRDTLDGGPLCNPRVPSVDHTLGLEPDLVTDVSTSRRGRRR